MYVFVMVRKHTHRYEPEHNFAQAYTTKGTRKQSLARVPSVVNACVHTATRVHNGTHL